MSVSAEAIDQEPKKKAQVAHVEKRANPCAPSHSLIPKASLYERPRAGVDSARIVNDCRNIRAHGPTDRCQASPRQSRQCHRPIRAPRSVSRCLGTTVTIKPDGHLFLDELSVTEETLRQQIVDQLEPEQEALITIKADEQTYHGQVITVMDELRAIEGASLGIATVPEPVK